MHLTQSMAAYLAADGLIEPTKIVMAKAMKEVPDLGQFLHGGPFTACAQIYRNLSSSYDFNASWFTRNKNTRSPSTRSIGYSSRSPVTHSKDSGNLPFPIGFVMHFKEGTRACHPTAGSNITLHAVTKVMVQTNALE